MFVAFWTVLPMLAVLVGLSSGMARTGGREVALPIWFLAVYLQTVAAAPPLLAAHQRYGVRLLVALAAGAATVDAVRYGFDVGWIGVLNYAFVWLAILELGFLWREARSRASGGSRGPWPAPGSRPWRSPPCSTTRSR